MNFKELFAKKSVVSPPVLPRPQTEEIAVSRHGFFARQSPVILWNPDQLAAYKGHGIYREMMRDDQVKAAYMLVVDTIAGRQFRFVPNPQAKDEARQEKLIEFFEYNTETAIRGTFVDALKQILTSKMTGYSVNEIVVEAEEYDAAMRWVVRALKLRPAETFRFEVDEFSNVLALMQQQAGGEKRLDPRKFIVHVANRELDPIYGESDLRAAYRHWWAKQNVMRFQEIGLERYASGFAHAKIGANAGLSSGQEQNLRDAIANLQASTSITTPEDVNIEIIQATPTDAHEKAISQYNASIARALLMPNLLGLTPQSKVGAYAQSKTQETVFFKLLSRQGDNLADTLNEQLWRPMAMWNFGEQYPPHMVFEQYSDEEKREIVEAWTKAIEGGAVVNTLDDENRNREMLGYEPREEDDQPLQPAQPNAAPGTEQPGEGDTQGQPAEQNQGERAQAAAAFASKRYPRPQRMDFKSVERGFNADQRAAVENIASRVDLIYQDIETTLRERMTVEALDGAINPRNRGGLKAAIMDHLARAYRFGRSQARDELDSAFALMPQGVGERLSLTAKYGRKMAYLGDGPMVAAFVSGLDLATAEKYFSDKAFTMTGDLSDKMTNTAKTILLNGIRDEKSVPEIVEELREALGDVIGELDSAGRRRNVPALLETIVRTTYTEAFNQSRLSVFADPDLEGFVEALEYSAIMDDRTTQFCRSADGKVYPFDSDVWSNITPPNHFNCRSVLIPVTAVDEWEPSPDLPESVQPSQGFK